MTISSSIINQLNPKVSIFLEELDTIPWFKNVGQPIHSEEVKQLFSWDDAWLHLQSSNWINASFHARNLQRHCSRS